MARIRTIKPEFFTSEDIVGLSPFARLLYIALWCEADREGRLAWKPKTFKLRYLPADTIDVDALCGELLERGLVRLYGDGLAYIPKFSDHQHVNPRESASTLPEPDASGTRESRVGTRHYPDSDAQVGKEREGREGKEKNIGASPDGDAPAGNDPIPYQGIVDAYNRTLENLPKVRDLTPKRRSLIRSAWQASPQRRSLGFWTAYFAECQDDPFLNGTGPYGKGHENWRPDFDYLLRADVVTRTFERAMDRMEREA